MRPIQVMRDPFMQLKSKRISFKTSIFFIIVSLVTLSLDTPTLGPQLPIFFLLSVLMIILPILFGASLSIRLCSLILLFFILGLTALRFNNYEKFKEEVKDFSLLTASLHNLYPKIINYCEQHQSASLTNISDYIRVGALLPNDTNFLGRREFKIYPYSQDTGRPLLEVWRNGTKVILRQNGKINFVQGEK